MNKINNLEKIARSARYVGDFIEKNERATGDRINKVISQITQLTTNQIRERIYAVEITAIIQRLQVIAKTISPSQAAPDKNNNYNDKDHNRIFGSINSADSSDDVEKSEERQADRNKNNKNNKNKNRNKNPNQKKDSASPFAEFEEVLLRLQGFTRPPPEARSFIFPPKIEEAIAHIFTELKNLESRKPLDLAKIQTTLDEQGIHTLEDALNEFLYVSQEEYGIVTVEDLVIETTAYAKMLGIETVDDFIQYAGGIAAEYGAEELIILMEMITDVSSGLNITDLEEFLAILLEISNQYDIKDIEDFVDRLGVFATHYNLTDLKKWARNFDAKALENLVEYASDIEVALEEEQDIRRENSHLEISNDVDLENIHQDFKMSENLQKRVSNVVEERINSSDGEEIDSFDREKVAAAAAAKVASLSENDGNGKETTLNFNISSMGDNSTAIDIIKTINNVRGTSREQYQRRENP